jgi:hypothetical protein
MDRRLAGLAVLILVVVAATVVPGLSGRRVAGSAVPKAFPTRLRSVIARCQPRLGTAEASGNHPIWR